MDPAYLQRFLSDSARTQTRNEIRELLKLISRADIISLAGGLPSPDAFPIDELKRIIPDTLERYGTSALQYGATEGDVGLRQELLKLMAAQEGGRFREIGIDNILITSASQQALDLCSRVFISTHDAVVCGLPSYLGALGAFTACGAKLSGVLLDDSGMRTDLLEQRLVDLRRRGVRPKMLYVVPDFQNPAGVSLSLERRRELLQIAHEFDLLVIEDSPYRDLRYVGRNPPSLFDLDRDGRVISMFTFSKILFPGLRLGWVVADEEVISRLAVAKQPVDLCTSGLSQVVAREYLKTGGLGSQIARIRKLYSVKREVMLRALDDAMKPEWGVRWTRPEGGLFLWMVLPSWMKSRELFARALEAKIAFVNGDSFHCDGTGDNTLRLNFSFPEPDELRTAAARLAGVIGDMVAEHGESRAAEAPSSEPSPAVLVSGDHSLEQLGWNLALHEVQE
ncbi:MAG: PLP-dependent aminotransferase family protein [bacterium]|nr:PLP-dependent aminotransferase family protein [bacterium]